MEFDINLFQIAFKKYLPIFFAALFGALTHAFEEIHNIGWKGWVAFFTDIIACSFTGFAFYNLSLLVYPEGAVIFTSLGSYWGTKGFVIIRQWALNTLKANLK